MSFVGILLLAVSAGMHAGWNLVCKARHPSAAFFLVATGTVCVALAPVVCWHAPVLPRLPGALWALLAATGITQAVYYTALGNAYRETEVSIAYPLARALPVLLIPAVTLALGLGKPLTVTAVGGMAVVAAGCVILPLPPWRTLGWRMFWRRGYLFILVAAAGTTAYTIIDSEALRLLRGSGLVSGRLANALLYVALENLCILPFLALYLGWHTGERRQLRTILREAWRYPVAAGLVCTAAYTLVLVAMGLASNVSYVMAFRQLSIPIGAGLGVWLLREPGTPAKVVGVCLICAGLAVVACR